MIFGRGIRERLYVEKAWLPIPAGLERDLSPTIKLDNVLKSPISGRELDPSITYKNERKRRKITQAITPFSSSPSVFATMAVPVRSPVTLTIVLPMSKIASIPRIIA
ncbi:106aa long hypothetical protein [Pyrococcus horikoshii OT3]|uniref:Uncharacterized protein n=1 Tax=Pyrococcus horikoshii (strain ATCC 700860 / DSM 12428 / JCM 9974 / NBRC 100139 / OT-3) TaxID=70601 RepID=O59009_PYRHO|nr:106aa long hypothetical protein [Pyrococcus horikoshii OT3]